MSHAKYLSSSPCGFEEEDFLSFHYMYKGKPVGLTVTVLDKKIFKVLLHKAM